MGVKHVNIYSKPIELDFIYLRKLKFRKFKFMLSSVWGILSGRLHKKILFFRFKSFV